MADQKPALLPGSIDDYLQDSSLGTINTAIGNNFYGFNHRQMPTPIPMNKDSVGYAFFVRPQLNMQTDNLRNSRIMTPLLTYNMASYQAIVRCTLDPRMVSGYPVASSGGGEGGNGQDMKYLNCPLIDNQQAFIPFLSNQLKSLTGWPDMQLPTSNPKGGAYQEEHLMVDGIVQNYTSYDIEATFRNVKGDPVMALFFAWEHYISAVFEGVLMPYPDMLIENEIDYMTRIYRITLDPQKNKVQKIAATGVSFPTSLPMGAAFDFSSEKPFHDANGDITIRFKCLGAQYQDDILIYEFNKTVQIFNPSMRPENLARDMIMIPEEMLNILNHRGYPRINPNTYELNWFLQQSYYNQRIKDLISFGQLKPSRNSLLTAKDII